MVFDPRRLLPAAVAAFPARPAGYWFYAGHVLLVWAIAASNAFLGLMILWSGREARRGRRLWRFEDHGVLFAPAGVYAILLAVSVAFSRDLSVSGEHLREVFSLATLALAPFLVRGERDVRRLFDLLILMVTLLAAWGIGQYYLTDFGEIHKRITGPFSHYQTFAGVLLVGDLLLLARIFAGGNYWRRPGYWLACALVNWTLMLTLTRGPWVAVGITFTGYVLVRARRYFAVYLGTALVATVLMAFLVPDSGDRIRSIVDLRDASNYDRLCMVHAGLHMISERPLFGHGPGMVRELYPIYRHPTAPRFTVPHLHNSFLELAAERGLASLAAYLWLMAAGIALAWRAYRREGGPQGPRADLYVGVILVLIGFNLAGLFEDNWRDTEVQRLVLFLLAVPLCLKGPSLE